jgi:hypothetical protein
LPSTRRHIISRPGAVQDRRDGQFADQI